MERKGEEEEEEEEEDGAYCCSYDKLGSGVARKMSNWLRTEEGWKVK